MQIDNTNLIDSINKLKEEKTKEAQNKMINEVLKSRFMCPVILEGAPSGGGKIKITKETKIQFSIIKTTDGKSFLIAFTSEPEVHKWQQNKKQQSIIYTFEDYAMLVTNNEHLDGFIIDPKGSNIVFTEQMIKEIKSNLSKTATIEEGTKIQLGIPKDYPQELVDKLKDLFTNLEDVKEAYLLLMTKEEQLSYLVVIDAGGKEKELYSTIASAAIPFLNGMPLNLLEVSTDLGQNVKRDFKPFYNIADEYVYGFGREEENQESQQENS